MRVSPGANRNDAVERFVDELEHPLREAIVEVREIILTCDDRITERIKWNAPSFCIAGDDRVTFRLAPRGIFQLVFHRGARARGADGFMFDDPTGLLTWASPDRATLDLTSLDDVQVRRDALVTLVRAWMAATAPGAGGQARRGREG